MPENIVNELSEAIIHYRPLPAINCKDVSAGYELQTKVTQVINGNKHIGFKAGLTSVAIQKQFGLKAPLIGSIYERGALQSGAEFSTATGQQLECEVGVIIDSQGSPIALVPIIELPCLQFSRPADLTIPNLIATNLGADRFIVGSPIPWDQHLQKVFITVRKNNVPIAQLSNDYSFETFLAGAQWMVNEAKLRGLWQQDNQQKLLLLGTCTEAITPEPGEYHIDFDILGHINFTITAM